MKKHFYLFLSIVLSWSLNAQNDSKILSNTPSSLMKKGQFEIQSYQNMYTQVDFRDQNGDYIDGTSRTTYFTSLNYFLLGISENQRVNLGLDVNFRTVFADQGISSPLNTFKFQGGSVQRSGISSLGPKIKLQPLKNVKNFSIQSAFWITVMDSLETKANKPWLDWNRYTSWSQFFYDIKTEKFQYFFEIDLLARISKPGEGHGIQLNTPASFFLSYIPNDKLIFYAMSQYTPTLTDENTYFFQSGLGSKIQLNEHLNLEFMFSDFLLSGAWGGTGQTYNIGIRWIK